MTIPRLALTLAFLVPSATAQGVAYEWPVSQGADAVAAAGDVDGDGAADFAISIRGVGSAFGRVDVRSGRDGGLLWSSPGALAGDGFGANLVALGDLDGDGRDDLAASATYVWPFGLGPAPSVRARSGADGSTLWQADAPTLAEQFGRSLARVSDLDGDGVDDLVVGSTLPSPGSVRVLSGASGALLLVLQSPAGAGAEFGAAVAALGDVDGDGLEEIGVGDPGFASAVGRISVHSGSDGAVLLVVDVPAAYAQSGAKFGERLAGIGDVDANGIPDLVASLPGATLAPAQSSGRVLFLSGADGGVLGELAPEPGSTLQGLGVAIARTDDLDGDGTADLRVAAKGYPLGGNVYQAAELRTYSGASGALLQRWPGFTSTLIGVVPDANADGRADLLVGEGTVAKLLLDGPQAPKSWPSCAGQATSGGCVPLLTTLGTPSLTQFADLELRVAKLPVGTVGLFLYGPNPTTTPLGNGVLCVGPPFVRTPLQPSTTFVNSCASQLGAAFKTTLAKPDLAALGLSAGDGFHVQAWFRDPGFAPPNDFGLSGALFVELWP